MRPAFCCVVAHQIGVRCPTWWAVRAASGESGAQSGEASQISGCAPGRRFRSLIVGEALAAFGVWVFVLGSASAAVNSLGYVPIRFRAVVFAVGAAVAGRFVVGCGLCDRVSGLVATGG